MDPAPESIAPASRPSTLLITGASGYLGGRLVPRLLAAGHRCRLLVRDADRVPAELRDRCAIIAGDAGDAADVARAAQGCEQAYYLIHAMRDHRGDFAQRDRSMAASFARACADAGIQRIIYFGGLGDPKRTMSEHLRSRQEVGAALAVAGIPVCEFRAGVVIGSGSASFEMLRHLAERLPVMLTPRWVRTRCQPIAVRDALHYLVLAADRRSVTGVVEIGGADVTTYAGLMRSYAAERGLTRWILPVPLLSPGLSSWWVHLVTPIPRAIAAPLIGGLTTEVVVRDDRARQAFPEVEPMASRSAISLALQRLASGAVETAWCSSLSSLADSMREGQQLALKEGMYLERHSGPVATDSATLFRACCMVGGANGWPASGSLWRIRALMDQWLGGPGMRRGRPSREQLATGDAVDFWRVEAVEPGRLLRLRAEMLLPGHGWLQFEALPRGPLRSRVRITAFYDPHGLGGWLYWLATLPLHKLVFPAMVRGIRRWAMALARNTDHG